MNRTPPTRNTDDAKAAAFFTGALTLAAGGAGLLVAGLVLGFDYLLHGQPDERAAVAEQRARNSRQRYEDALAWLEADRADRARARMAKREWFTADPATRGAAPDSGETAGRLAARLWNSLIVGGARFRRGWKDGRTQAEQRRAAGDPNWWRPSRPNHPVPGNDQEEPGDGNAPPPNNWFCPGCNKPMSAPREQRMEPEELWCPPCRQRQAAQGDARQSDDEILDVEIVDEPGQQAGRTVVPAGTDTPDTGDAPDLDGYAQRLDDLDSEVAANRNGRPVDPSPPRTVLQ